VLANEFGKFGLNGIPMGGQISKERGNILLGHKMVWVLQRDVMADILFGIPQQDIGTSRREGTACLEFGQRRETHGSDHISKGSRGDSGDHDNFMIGL